MGWQRLQKREAQLLMGGAVSISPSVQCPLPTDTLPSFVVPATCPVAMVTISGWTARLGAERQSKSIQQWGGKVTGAVSLPQQVKMFAR